MTSKEEVRTEAAPDTRFRERIIGHIEGKKPGPTLVFFAGIHGNEPAGVEALTICFDRFKNLPSGHFRGSFYGIIGNRPALEKGERFLDQDLNRIWLRPVPGEVPFPSDAYRTSEEQEQLQVYRLIRSILANHDAPVYFIDLHTTSGKTAPFITINDALINRKFARCFPVPIILGIEEYLQGPLLSYLNEEGYVAVGFESGQHGGREAVENAVAFIHLALKRSGSFPGADPGEAADATSVLVRAAGGMDRFYEIVYRHVIQPGDSFGMLPGFRNFDRINKGLLLATHNGQPQHAEQSGLLFMPLYQKKGEDGYFIIRHIPAWIMGLSAALRHSKLDAILPLLPGVARDPFHPARLLVNLRLARFFSRRFFHLMGYRHKQIDKHHAVFTNRERMARNAWYRHEPWY